MNSNIKRLKLIEKDKVIHFLNENWGSNHPLVNNHQLFEYYYADGEWANFYYIETDNQVEAVCGYIKSSNEYNSDIWISIWCAKKGKNGLGLTLMGKMQQLTGANVIACNNIRANTMPFYTFLGYYPGKLNHYYRIRNLSSYKIAKINDKSIIHVCDNSSKLIEFFCIDDVKKHFNNFKCTKPLKDYWYINRRYFNYPHYKYKVFGVFNNNVCCSLVVFRVNEGDEGYVLRLVDYIGTPQDISLLSSHIDTLMNRYNCEYCDMYCFGVDGKLAGFSLRDENDTNIIPNYLNPLLQENIDYYFFTSDTNNFMMFRADGDQDRKNIK